jgi:lauroyl/myristoyl acyltransferase
MLYRLPPSVQDYVRSIGMAAGAGLTALASSKADARVAAAVVAFRRILRPNPFDARAREIADILALDPSEGRRVWQANQTLRMASALGRARGVRHGWRPTTMLEGLDRIREVQAEGRGAILWRMSFCESPVAKIALAREALAMVHLSSVSHGARSQSRGGGWVTALYRRGEDPYLAERVVMPADGSLGYMRGLMTKLRAGALVSIFAEYPSRRSVRVPMFGGTVELATGAPALAVKTGSALFPTRVRWEGGDRYTVIIEPAIDLPEGAGRRDVVASAVDDFASRLEAAIRSTPESWMRWPVFLYNRSATRADVRPPPIAGKR